MPDLRFDTGLVEYSINGVNVTFNPTDGAFVERVYNAFDMLDKKQEEYTAGLDATNDSQIFDAARKLDQEMRSAIDKIFSRPICDELFGFMNVYAISSNGIPVWAELLLAIMSQVDAGFTERQKKTSATIAKYTAKYHK